MLPKLMSRVQPVLLVCIPIYRHKNVIAVASTLTRHLAVSQRASLAACIVRTVALDSGDAIVTRWRQCQHVKHRATQWDVCPKIISIFLPLSENQGSAHFSKLLQFPIVLWDSLSQSKSFQFSVFSLTAKKCIVRVTSYPRQVCVCA